MAYRPRFGTANTLALIAEVRALRATTGATPESKEN